VLVGVDDVAAGVGEEAADRGDQSRLIGAGEEQARRMRAANDAEIIWSTAQPTSTTPEW
jgi:hypothetical protein